MNLRRLCGVLVLAWAGCSSNPMDDWQCACETNVTFALPRPLAGVGIQISVEEPDGNVESLDCQPNGSALACLPLSSRLVPNFDASGALQSVTIDQAVSGSYTVELVVGGTPMGGGTFVYSASSTTYGPCGQESCETPGIYTISN